MDLSLMKDAYIDRNISFQMHLPEYMLVEKMPDSPDSLLAENQVKSQNHKNNSNCSLSPPHATSSGRSPSPTTGSPPQRVESSSSSIKNRQVLRIKRFLATLQQYAVTISSEAAEKVHSLILGLVGASISIEEFHQKILEVTNHPLQSFASSFLKTHLPILQAELLYYSRLAKQTPQQYLRYNEHVVLGNTTQSTSHHPSELFQPITKENNKRTAPTSRGTKPLSDFEDSNPDCLPPAKRYHSATSPRVSPASSSHLSTGLFRGDDHYYRDGKFDKYDRFERDYYRPLYGGLSRDYVEERELEDEWRNIHTMMHCILGMVEKTKRALVMLQPRFCNAERSELSNWPRLNRHLESNLESNPKTSRPHEFAAHYKTAEDRVADMRRRAEDAVNEVKRQAVAELQIAVTAAESKAQELVATERLKMERLLSDVRRQAAEDAVAVVTHQQKSTENCWNCGRKGHKTCGGCNKARYCSSFCQHKDWDNHLRSCSQSPLPSTSKTLQPTRDDKSPSPLRSSLLDIKNIKTDSL